MHLKSILARGVSCGVIQRILDDSKFGDCPREFDCRRRRQYRAYTVPLQYVVDVEKGFVEIGAVRRKISTFSGWPFQCGLVTRWSET